MKRKVEEVGGLDEDGKGKRRYPPSRYCRACPQDDQKFAIYGFKGGKRTYCLKHKSDGMINLSVKYCVDCTGEQPKQAKFGFLGGEMTHCTTHKLEGMVDLVNPTCLMCGDRANYGYKGEKKLYCSKHKDKGMIRIGTNYCKCENAVQAYFGFQWKKPTHCSNCQLPGMKDVVHKRCTFDGCDSLSLKYGNQITGQIFCAQHADKKKHWVVKRCYTKKCKKWAFFSETGVAPFFHCEQHYDALRERSFLEVVCANPDCGVRLPQLCDEDGFCLDACTVLHPRYEKKTENAMRDMFEENSIQIKRVSRTVEGSTTACGRFQPDFPIDVGCGIIVVENDENQHKSRVDRCEYTRMVDLYQAFGGLPVHFIRFNPDPFVCLETGKRTFVPLYKRFNALLSIITPLISEPVNAAAFFAEFPTLSVRYLFYDLCRDAPLVLKFEEEFKGEGKSQ